MLFHLITVAVKILFNLHMTNYKFNSNRNNLTSLISDGFINCIYTTEEVQK
jgi:hypothetical protein